eukprot:568968-Prymnesium_polylepis.1
MSDINPRVEEDNARAAALAMALHMRIGAASPARILTSDLLRMVAAVMRVLNRRYLVCVMVRAGQYIDRIVLRFSTGDDEVSRGEAWERTGGDWQPPFLLKPGERIVRVSGRVGGGLDAIQFQTDRGRLSLQYGGSGGRAFEEHQCVNGILSTGLSCVGLKGLTTTPEGYLAGKFVGGEAVTWDSMINSDEADVAATHLASCFRARSARQPDVVGVTGAADKELARRYDAMYADG